MQKIAIIGAGISGLSLAILLAESGEFIIDIFEKNNNKEDDELKSYNLTISTRGMNYLEKLQVKPFILQSSVYINARCIIQPNGNLCKQFYDIKKLAGLYSISRNNLLSILIDRAKQFNNINIFYAAKLIDIDTKINYLVIYYNQQYLTKGRYNFIVGADGAYSKTRSCLLQSINSKFKMDVSHWVYKKFTISKTDRKNFNIIDDSIMMWHSDSGICIGIPNIDSSLSVLFITKINNNCEQDNVSNNAFSKFCAKYKNFEIFKMYVNDRNINFFNEVHLTPWFYKDKIVILGDAAHSVVPFYGQGMNFSLECSNILAQHLLQSNNTSIAFERYYKTQKPAADALSTLCYKHIDKINNHYGTIFYEVHSLSEKLIYLLIPSYKNEYTLVSDGDLKYDAVIKKLKRRKLLYIVSGWFIIEFVLILFVLIKKMLGK